VGIIRVWGNHAWRYSVLLANNDSFYDYLETGPCSLPVANEAWTRSDFSTEFESLPPAVTSGPTDRVAYDARLRSTIADRAPRYSGIRVGFRLTRLCNRSLMPAGDRSTASITRGPVCFLVVYLMVMVFFAAMVVPIVSVIPVNGTTRQWHPRVGEAIWDRDLPSGLRMLWCHTHGVPCVYWRNHACIARHYQ